MAEINEINCVVRRRRWNWLGHVLRREGENDCFAALGWTPEGRRARGRPKTTWRRTVERERNKAGWKSWNVAKAAARSRECWSENMWEWVLVLLFSYKFRFTLAVMRESLCV